MQRIAKEDITILALKKGSERYIVLFNGEHADDALLKIGQWACHPELSFDWMDGAELSRRVRAAQEPVG